MEQWVDQVAVAAGAGAAASAYLELCDQVRDDVLPPLGVRLEDKAQGYVWKLDDPAVLARERAAKKAAEGEAARKKLENKLEKTKKELDKWVGLSVAPAGACACKPARACACACRVRAVCARPHVPTRVRAARMSALTRRVAWNNAYAGACWTRHVQGRHRQVLPV